MPSTAIPPKWQVILGLVQMSGSAHPQENMRKVLDRIKKAASLGAQIVCLQELTALRYFCQVNDNKFFALAEPIPGPSTKVFSELARELKIVIVTSLFEKEARKYFNTVVTFDVDGKLAGKYRKLHIPDDLKNHYSELYYFKSGNLPLKPIKTKYATIGTLVCWDQWYPEPPRFLAFKGAEIIFYPTAIGWPNNERATERGRTEFDAWVTIQRSHAIANGVFVAACNRTQMEDHIYFWGGSFVADPFGKILKQASHDEEEIVITQCDLGRIKEVRNDWPFLACRRKGLK